MSVRPLVDNVSLAIGMMLLAYLLFATLDSSTKWMLGLGVPALQLAFLRYAGHLAVNVVEVGLRGRENYRLSRSSFGLASLRSGLLVVSTVTNFIALQYLPLTVTSAIMFSAPIILCLLSGPMLGETVGPWRWSAIFLGFGGVLIVINPFGESFQWAVVLSLFNAVGLALYSLLTRKLAGTVSAAAMQLLTGFLGTLVLAPFAFSIWVEPVNDVVLAFWFAIGVVGWAGHELLTRAHAFAPASTLMPYSYSFLIYMTLFSVVLFGHAPAIHVWIGIVVIVASGLLIWWRETLKS